MPRFTYHITENEVANKLDLTPLEASRYDFGDDIADAVQVVRKYLEPNADLDHQEELQRVALNIAAHFALEKTTGVSTGEAITRESELDVTIEYAEEGVVPAGGSSNHWRRAVLLDPTATLADSGGDVRVHVI